MRVLVAIVGCVVAGCPASKGTGPAQQNGPTGPTSTAMMPAVPYTQTLVSGCGEKTGTQTVVVAKGSGAAFVTISDTDTTSPCVVDGRPPTTAPNYALCYGEVNGSDVATQIAATIPLIQYTGVGLAVGATGQVSIGYTGGPNVPARCGGSDMVVITKTSGAFGAPQTLATGSMAPLSPDQVTQCPQDVCQKGEATGFWPALTYVDNTLAATYRDLHFGFAGDDFGKSDVETNIGGTLLTVDVAQGGGTYLRVGSTADGKLSIVHYNADGPIATHGIWHNRQTAAGWERQRITDKQIGEQLGFAVNKNGLHGVAFFNVADKRLSYLESADAEVWTDPEDVDTDGLTGQYPSLAFDAAGEPAIAYYRCNDYSKDGTTCDQAKDGLYLARRVQGTWVKTQIVANGASFEGLYPGITFVGGKVLIAYQKRTFDPSSGATKSELYLAKEP